MRDYIRLAGVLLIVCVFAAALLGYTNSITYGKIQDQIRIENDLARKAVLSEATEFVLVDDETMSGISSTAELNLVNEIYEARSNGNPIGYAIKVSPKGYGGIMEIIVGVDINGNITGIKVGNNTETPGLGKNAESPVFQNQYVNKTWEQEIRVIKSGTPKDNEIAALAGSTITSRAVTDGVNQAMAAARVLLGK